MRHPDAVGNLPLRRHMLRAYTAHSMQPLTISMAMPGGPEEDGA